MSMNDWAVGKGAWFKSK